jgi:two-component system, chemotaxis family, sensor kinase Cph1
VRRLRNFIGQGEIALEPIDLHTVIRQGVELALAATTEPHPRVVLDFTQGLPPIEADPVQIGQVVLNLVRNSLTAMAKATDPLLKVSTRINRTTVEVAVTDTGAGIDPNIEKTLFEPFHNSTTSGMGIGLSLSRSIVEAHGGRIWTEPVTYGARFLFTLKMYGRHEG